MFGRTLFKTTTAAPSLLHRPAFPALQQARLLTRHSRPFTVRMPRNTSGMTQREWNYDFESKIDRGGFPHQYQSFMKVLGQDYDTSSAQHIENLESMQRLNLELMERVDETMQISKEEELKLIKRSKSGARDRIRKLLDRGSPFLAMG